MDLVDDQLFRNVLIMAMHLGRKHIGTSNMSAVLDSHLPRTFYLCGQNAQRSLAKGV